MADFCVAYFILGGESVVARVVLPQNERGCERYAVFLHRGEKRFVPWAGVRRGVSDDVAAADLQGFTHREVALIATTLARLGKGRSNLPRYARLCTRDDIRRIDRLAVVIELADELDRRVNGGGPPTVRMDERRDRVVVTTGLPYVWEPADLTRRFRTRLGRTLSLRPAETVGDRTKTAEPPNGRLTGRGPRRG